MRRRFAREELLSAEPYDPVGGFGRRVFLFGAELEPLIARFAADRDAELRRAAVSALGGYRTRSSAQVLLGVAVTSDDPVAMFRALAGLGRAGVEVDAAPLVVRLERTTDLHERTALIGALARLQASRAVPAIAGIGREALDRSQSDLLVTALGALARIPAHGHAELVRELADDVLAACASRPGDLEPSGGPAPVQADRSDGPRSRSEVLGELARIARARLAPLEREVQRDLLGRLAVSEPEDPLAPGAAWLNGISLARIRPPAQVAFLDLLASMEQAGVAPLLRLADDPALEPALRIEALARAPAETRRGELGRWLEGSPWLALRALELAEGDANPEAAALARDVLARARALPAGGGSSEERRLAVQALRVLQAAGQAAADDLLPLAFHARAPRHAFGDLPERVHELVLGWAARFAKPATRAAIRRAAEHGVALVVDAGLRAELAGRTEELVDEIAERLDSLHRPRGGGAVPEVVLQDVEELLLGYPLPRWSRERAEFHPPVPFEEELLLALGRTRDARAVAFLEDLLSNRKHRLRSTACLALGLSGGQRAARAAAPFLIDPEPFTRWCAYLAIAHSTGISEPIDWLYAPEPEHYAAAERVWRRMREPR
jgi:hypothetical protein